MSINLKELLDIAKHQLKDLATWDDPDFRLEQAEYNKKDKVWDIVVSYLVKNTNARERPATPGMASLSIFSSEPPYQRIYKGMKIDENKELVSFFIFNN